MNKIQETRCMEVITSMQRITVQYGKSDSIDARSCGGNSHPSCKHLSVNQPDDAAAHTSFKGRSTAVQGEKAPPFSIP
jgi:hypothetical protein